MKKLFMLTALAFASPSFAAKDIMQSEIVYVYQPDLAPTEFEFQSNIANSCGSHLYRVKSNDEATAQRKFSIVLTAFSTGKNLAFNDTETCQGSRSIVSWVRVTN